MSSSGSSSTSSKAKKKKDKSKKDKKSKKDDKKSKKEGKKAKKDEKKSKKAKKGTEQAKEWFCDRLDAIKYTRQLLEIDSAVATELEVLFESIDEGEVVRIDGLENKQVKKKLRHLLQALKLTPEGENGFKSADRKVSFAALFTDCMRRAKEKTAAIAAAQAPAAVVVDLDDAPPAAPPEPVDARDAAAAECGEEDAAESLEPPPPKAKKPRMKGPQLPMPGIGAVDASEDEGSSDHDTGPRMQGDERQGVDLNSLPTVNKRAQWMTEAGANMAGIFGDVGPRKADKYEVQRSKAEQEAFEKAFKERGASLMSETREGKFQRDDAKKTIDDMHAKLKSHEEVWGLSEKQQERSKNVALSGARKAFNPEEDLRVRKPISGSDFNKFVEEAGGELAGRFSRGGVASSFL